MAHPDPPDLFEPAPFPVQDIPRLEANSPEALERMKRELPVILTNSNIAENTIGRWDPKYLADHMGQSVELTVFHSKTNKFLYWSDEKNLGGYPFQEPTAKKNQKFGEFFSQFQRPPGVPDEDGFCFHYLQQGLVVGVGDQILDDFQKWNWDLVNHFKRELGFGPLTTNMLLISQRGCITPCKRFALHQLTLPGHYDEQQNLFLQIHGRKRVLLFNPDMFAHLGAYPMHHPHDRQCQVDIFNPALDLFPTFGQLQGFDAVVNPGDVLYIPSYWFHHVVSLDESVSVTFWLFPPCGVEEVTLSRFKAGPSPNLSFPLNPVQRAALRRNLEDLVAKAVGHPKVGEFLAAMRDNTDADVPNFAQNADAVRVLLGKVGITEPADQHQFLADWVNVRFSVCAQGGAAKNS